MSAPRTTLRTGDVVRVEASALDASGRLVAEAPLTFSLESFPIDTLLAPPAAARVSRDGRFVAEKPGAYVVHASSGNAVGSVEFRVEGREVARYQVPEARTHNLWVDGDRLYVGYYNGGLRVVDISGELMGDLYRQGREIAVCRAWAEDGFVANTPMMWGPQLHKGNVFFSEFNSGLWAVRLEPKWSLVP